MIVRFVLNTARGLMLPFRRELPRPAGIDEASEAPPEEADGGIMVIVLGLVLLAWVLGT